MNLWKCRSCGNVHASLSRRNLPKSCPSCNWGSIGTKSRVWQHIETDG